MTTRKSKPKKFVIDGRAFDMSLPETTLTLGELLQHGTPAERREALTMIGFMLKSRRQLPEHLAEIIGDALVSIGDGSNAAEAFGLPSRPGKEKQFGIRYAKIVEYLVADLCRQGMSTDDAWDVVARLDPTLNELTDDPERTAVEKLKKRLKRRRTK